VQTERLHAGDREPQLVIQGGDDRRAAAAADVEMRLAPAPVRNGEGVVGDHQPEPHHGERPRDDQRGHLVGGMIDGQVQPGYTQGREDDRGRPLAQVPPSASRHERVEHSDQRQGQHADRPRRLRVALPGAQDLDAGGPHPADLQRHGREQQRGGQGDGQVGREMPESPERDEHRDGPPGSQSRRPGRRQRVDVEHRIREPGGAYRRHRVQDNQVGPGNEAEQRGNRHGRPQRPGDPAEQQVPAEAAVDVAG